MEEKTIIKGSIAFMVFALLFNIGIIVFIGWVIVRVLQHFGII